MIHKYEPVRVALRNEKVLNFVQTQYITSYRNYFAGHEDEVEHMIVQAFTLLRDSHKDHNKIHPPSLEKVTKHISQKLFHIHDNAHWFNRMHYAYKLFIRPKKDYEAIVQHLTKGTIHDYGCDGGYFSFELLKHKHSLFLSDVVDHRIKEVKRVPFYLMKTPIDIQIKKDKFDNGIAKTVLHHINANNLNIILKKLRTMHKRLIIEEDIYGVPSFLQYCTNETILQKAMRQYAQLTTEEQYQYCILTDFFSNAVIYDRLDINFPFQFHTVDEWMLLFKEAGYTNISCKVTGFNEWKLTQNCQAWFICE